jgi:poly-D-alanine transfer protein DltD
MKISKGKDVSIETIMDAVKEDESCRALRNKPPAATDAFLARGLTDTKNVNNTNDSKDDRNTRDYRDSKEYRDIKEFKEAREFREFREFRDSKDYRNPRNDREFRNRPIQGKWCSYCESNTHTYAACYRRPRSDNRDNYSGFNTGQKRTFPSFECFHCGEQGHRSDNCPAKRRCKTVGYVEVRHRFRRYSSDETCLA